jgi:hypothetical protein
MVMPLPLWRSGKEQDDVRWNQREMKRRSLLDLLLLLAILFASLPAVGTAGAEQCKTIRADPPPGTADHTATWTATQIIV